MTTTREVTSSEGIKTPGRKSRAKIRTRGTTGRREMKSTKRTTYIKKNNKYKKNDKYKKNGM